MSVRAIVIAATGGASSSLLLLSEKDPRGISAAARAMFVGRGDQVEEGGGGSSSSWALVFPHHPHRAGARPFRITVEPLWGDWRGFRVTIDALGQVLDRDDLTTTPERDPKQSCYDTPHNRALGVGLLVGIPLAWDSVLNVRYNAFLTLPCCRCGENRYVTVNGDTLMFYMPSSPQRGAQPLCAFLDDWIRAWRGEGRYI